MNLLLLTEADFTRPGRVQLTDQRARHIIQVLGSAVGDSLKVGQLGGLRGSGTIIELSNNSVTLEVTLDTPPPAKLPLTLLLALPRPKVARRILAAATELGVESIILINSYRVEKSYWQSPLLDDNHLRNAMLEGLVQSGDTRLPSLTRAKLFKPFVEDHLPAWLSQRTGLLAHPYAKTACDGAPQNPCLLAIGPEGGFIPYEVDKLLSAGMTGISLGPRILRVETAVPTLIGALYY